MNIYEIMKMTPESLAGKQFEELKKFILGKLSKISGLIEKTSGMQSEKC